MNFLNFRSTHAATQLDTPTAPRMRANAFGEGEYSRLNYTLVSNIEIWQGSVMIPETPHGCRRAVCVAARRVGVNKLVFSAAFHGDHI